MKLYLTKAGRCICLAFALLLVSGQGAFAREPAPDSTAAGYTCPPEPDADEVSVTTDARDASRLRDQLADATRNLRSALRAKDPLQTAEIRRLAGLRKRHLIQLARTDPAAASSELLSQAERDTINDSTVNCVETVFEVDGTAEVLIADNFDEGTSRTFYYVLTDQDERLNLYPLSALKTHVRTGQRVRVRGLQLDNNIILDDRSDLSISSSDAGAAAGAKKKPPPPPDPPPAVDRKTLVVLAYFLDTPQPIVTLDDAYQALDRVNDHSVENSYNKLALSGVINPDRGADVFGWYQVPLNQTCSYIENLQTRDEALNAAITHEGIDPNDYAGFVIAAPYGPNCSWAGLAAIGGALSLVRVHPAATAFSWVTTAHEIGHNLGNRHASFLLPCGGFPANGQGCEIVEYGDPYDIMGGSTGHYNAPHKEWVGFLDATQVLDVQASGTYSIEPIETATGGVKALKLQRGVDDYLYIEFRQPIGYDDFFYWKPNVFKGASLHITRPAGQTLLIDPFDSGVQQSALERGETFVDPVSGHSVTVTGVGRNELKVAIQHSGAELNPPTAAITSPLPGEELSGMVAVSATVTDDSGISQVDFYYDGQGLIEQFESITSESPDDIYIAMLDASYIPEGLYDLYVVATDVNGNTAESPRVQVSVLSPFAPTVTINSPDDGRTFAVGASITFTAVAEDFDGTVLTPDLVWESDLDGPLGTGGSVVTSSLIRGVHQITASVTNSAGYSGFETITVIVTKGGGCKKGCK